MEVISLTKQLINIPSYVGQYSDEKKLAEFIFDYLQRFPFLRVIKQPVINGRYNIIAFDHCPTKALFCGHIDTVEPKGGSKVVSIVKDDRIYGLGSTDMKGNLAVLICALESFKETKGLMILFYVDEEYDFCGLKKFIKEYKSKIKPKLVVSGDGYELAIGNGCRGLIELTCQVKGQAGHAATPQSGKNAILGSVEAVKSLSKFLKQNYSSEELGRTTCNLAFLQGGLNLGKKSNQVIIGRQGNNIADFAEFVLDIRPAKNNLRAREVIKALKSFLNDQGLTVKNVKVRHDFSPWLTPKSKLNSIEKIVLKTTEAKFENIAEYGYNDLQMIWQEFNGIACFTFGGGERKLAHTPNEYIKISNLLKTKEVYENLIEKFGGGERK